MPTQQKSGKMINPCPSIETIPSEVMSPQRRGKPVDICPSIDTIQPEVLKQFPNLFSPLSIGNVCIRNRVFISAHTTVLAENGGAGEKLIAFLEAKARGGVGLIISEAVNAHPSGSESKGELCSWEPFFAEGLKKLRERLDLYGTILFVQLFHSGGGGTHAGMMEKGPNIQPSNTSFLCEGLIGTSHALRLEEVEDLIQGYAKSAVTCKDNGAHGVEVAAAHGYLIHRFLSPLHNHRTDRFGGDFNKRLNFLREILIAIRKKVGVDFPIGVRIGCDDFIPESLSNDDIVNICKTLDQEKLIDFLDITGSHEFIQRSLIHHYGVMDDKVGHMVSKVANIRRAVSVPVLHAGRIINPRQAEDILAAGHIDMAGMTRASIADPSFIKKTVEQREADIIYCVGCAQACMGRVNHGKHVTCIQNPLTGREHEWGTHANTTNRKKIVVVGGGPAGMSFAMAAAARGHEVRLYDAHHELGGQVLLAEQFPLCLELGTVARNLSRQVYQAGVEVYLNTFVKSEIVVAQNPDEVVLATGSTPYLPHEVKGIEGDHVFTLERAFTQPDLLGDSVLLIDNDGHQRGASTAAWLIKIGKKVQVATEFSHIGCHFEMSLLRMRIYQMFFKNKIPLYPHYRLIEIGRKSVFLKDNYADTDLEIKGIDSVVVLYPPIAQTELEKDLRTTAKKIHLIGDCLAPRNIEYASFVGARLGRSI